MEYYTNQKLVGYIALQLYHHHSTQLDDKAKVGKRAVWHEIAFLAKNDFTKYSN